MASNLPDGAASKRTRHSSEASTRSSTVSSRLHAGVPFQGSRMRPGQSAVPSRSATTVPNTPASQADVRVRDSVVRPRRSAVPSKSVATVSNTPSSQADVRVRAPTMRSRRSEVPVKSAASVANTPLSQRGVRFRASMTPRVTQPRPFSFESRDKALLASRQQRVAAATEARVRLANSFRAQPMPVGPPDPLPPPRPTSLTAAASPHLQTRKRAVQRRAFEDLLAAKRASLDRKLEALRKEREERENAEIKELRRGLVHKPEPIRSFKPLESAPRRPLTRLQSANLAVSGR
ncbi:Protein tpx2 [Sparganum proliferum]